MTENHFLGQDRSDTVTSVVFSPDGRLVLTGSDDHMARVWEVSSGKVLATLQGHIGAVTEKCRSPPTSKWR